MAQIEFDLIHGMQVGDAKLKHVVLVEPTVADVLECSEESERTVMTPKGAALVSSPAVMGALMLCRQIKSIDGQELPFNLAMLKKLHADDLFILQQKADELDDASQKALEEITQRGRSDEDGDGA